MRTTLFTTSDSRSIPAGRRGSTRVKTTLAAVMTHDHQPEREDQTAHRTPLDAIGPVDTTTGQILSRCPGVPEQRSEPHPVREGATPHARAAAHVSDRGLRSGRGSARRMRGIRRTPGAIVAALVLGASLFVMTPVASGQSMWIPTQGLQWQYQLQGKLKTNICAVPASGGACVRPNVYDVDLYAPNGVTLNTAAVAAIHALGAHAVCYVDAGTWEDFRPDAGEYPASVKGLANGWPGERWLDIRATGILLPIITARVAKCAAAGFDAVDFDNVDGYENQTGFPLTAARAAHVQRGSGRHRAHATGCRSASRTTSTSSASSRAPSTSPSTSSARSTTSVTPTTDGPQRARRWSRSNTAPARPATAPAPTCTGGTPSRRAWPCGPSRGSPAA